MHWLFLDSKVVNNNLTFTLTHLYTYTCMYYVSCTFVRVCDIDEFSLNSVIAVTITVEEAIEKMGFGPFQILVTVFCGLLWVSHSLCSLFFTCLYTTHKLHVRTLRTSYKISN